MQRFFRYITTSLVCCRRTLLSVIVCISGQVIWYQTVQLFLVVCLFVDEDDQPVSRRNFMKMLKNGGRFGKRRRPSRNKKPIIKTKTLFIFGPENRWEHTICDMWLKAWPIDLNLVNRNPLKLFAVHFNLVRWPVDTAYTFIEPEQSKESPYFNLKWTFHIPCFQIHPPSNV